MSKEKFVDGERKKVYFSDEFNYVYNKQDGKTLMWGRTYEEDVDVSPFCMIVDFEITERCSGIGKEGPCAFCYKGNTEKTGYVTPYEEAKIILDKLPKECTQIAFGVDGKLKTNKDWFKIFSYARKKGFTPNVTVADLDEKTAKKLISVCGGVSVSRYAKKEYCYNTVNFLTKASLQEKIYVHNEDICLAKVMKEIPNGYQEMTVEEYFRERKMDEEQKKTFLNVYFPVNLHILLSKETLPFLYETLLDIKEDERLKYINSVVLLSLKKKGRGETFHSLSQEEFDSVIKELVKHDISYGFDTCSAHKYMKTLDVETLSSLKKYIETCESGRISFYINARGEGFPCSFSEGTKGWERGIDILRCKDFIKDVWGSPKIHNFREILLENDCRCPLYNI